MADVPEAYERLKMQMQRYVIAVIINKQFIQKVK